MVKKKGQSKRASLKLKVKISRHVKEHKRKLRKLSRKGGSAALKKKKDIGIPNSLPFKNEILAEIEHAKQKLEEKKLALREKRHQDRVSISNNIVQEIALHYFTLVCAAMMEKEPPITLWG